MSSRTVNIDLKLPTFLIADLPLLLPCIIRSHLQQALYVPQQRLGGRDQGVGRGVYGHVGRRARLSRVAHRRWRR